LNDTFYKSAQEQLDKVKEFAAKVPAKYLAQVAVFSRERGFMKDMPALLTVLLLKKDPVLAEKIFDRTIDNGKMLRNFFQMIRSGVAGSKSMASRPSRLVSNMLRQKTPMDLLFMSIGNDPSLVDIIKMIHFKPKDKKQDALISYLMGKKFNEKLLPEEVREYEALKKGESDEIPKVPFEMLVRRVGLHSLCVVVGTSFE
jgi:60 kDa SS-A/Ro ribonucleoprotein